MRFLHFLGHWAVAGVALGAVFLAGAPTQAETAILPARVIVPGEVLHAQDFAPAPWGARLPADAVASVSELEGMEARRELTPGAPVLRRALTPVRVVRRNEPVTLVFESGAVRVVVDGVALVDAAAGDTVRVANARTRRVVSGRAQADGSVVVR